MSLVDGRRVSDSSNGILDTPSNFNNVLIKSGKLADQMTRTIESIGESATIFLDTATNSLVVCTAAYVGVKLKSPVLAICIIASSLLTKNLRSCFLGSRSLLIRIDSGIAAKNTRAINGWFADNYSYIMLLPQAHLSSQRDKVSEVCIEAIKKGYPSKYASVVALQQLIQKDQLSEKNKREFVRLCLASVQKGWNTKYVGAVALGQLFMDKKLNKYQGEEFFNTCIDSINGCWESAPICLLTLGQLQNNHALSGNQSSKFKKACSQHNQKYLAYSNVCKNALGVISYDLLCKYCCQMIDRDGMACDAQVLALMNRPPQRTESFEKLVDLCIQSVDKGWRSCYICAILLNRFAMTQKLANKEKKRLFEVCVSAIKKAKSTKYTAAVIVGNIGLDENRQGEFEELCYLAEDNKWATAEVCKIALAMTKGYKPWFDASVS